MSLSTTCTICCEDNNNLFSLGQCSHMSCGNCLVQWIETVEALGQTSLPGCPFCQVTLTREETQLILGRPYTPATKSLTIIAREEIDDLTRQLLQEITKPCPHCGAWIEKKQQEDCDKMECLCGYRFCYSCGVQGATCSCAPERHVFWDNALDRGDYWYNKRREVREAQVDDGTGHVDLMKHIQQRQWELLREEREIQQYQLKWECESVSALTYSAPWLFASKSRAVTLQMLSTQVEMELQRHRQCPSCDTWKTWNYRDGSIIKCSCQAQFCFWCGSCDPESEGICQHGNHRCSHAPEDVDSWYFCWNCEHDYGRDYVDLVDLDYDYGADFYSTPQSIMDGQKHSYGGKLKLLWKGSPDTNNKSRNKDGQLNKKRDNNKHAKRQKAKQALIRQLKYVTS